VTVLAAHHVLASACGERQAAREGNDCVDYLIGVPGIDLNPLNDELRTPLHWAAVLRGCGLEPKG